MKLKPWSIHKGRRGEWQPVGGANFWPSMANGKGDASWVTIERSITTIHRFVRRTKVVTRSWQDSDRLMRDTSPKRLAGR